jgi:hypothetical protein
MRLTIEVAFLIIAMLVGFPRESIAHSGTAEEQAACTPDVFSLCSSEIPDEKRIVACLNRKIGQLSSECRKVIAGPGPNKNRRSKH